MRSLLLHLLYQLMTLVTCWFNRFGVLNQSGRILLTKIAWCTPVALRFTNSRKPAETNSLLAGRIVNTRLALQHRISLSMKPTPTSSLPISGTEFRKFKIFWNRETGLSSIVFLYRLQCNAMSSGEAFAIANSYLLQGTAYSSRPLSPDEIDRQTQMLICDKGGHISRVCRSEVRDSSSAFCFFFCKKNSTRAVIRDVFGS